MHFLHFSLATKQPAMTAPTIARELDGAGTPEGVDSFVSSVVALIRTQAAAVFGNVMLVFPVCLGVQLLWHMIFHANIISPEKAHATLHSFSLIGPTPFYAALTGVLLWSSSLLAGWADGDATKVDSVEIHWPSGAVERLSLLPGVDRFYSIEEGRGIVAGALDPKVEPAEPAHSGSKNR